MTNYIDGRISKPLQSSHTNTERNMQIDENMNALPNVPSIHKGLLPLNLPPPVSLTLFIDNYLQRYSK